MNWEHFQTYNDAPTHAFEAMCNQLFELWCIRNHSDNIKSFFVVNGAGGDGGVEAYTVMHDDSIIAVQSKWFRNSINNSQIAQIKNSVKTAMKLRPLINKYIVCVPRDLSSIKEISKNGKVAQNTEIDRWNALKTELFKSYPLLEIELWNETRILRELQYPECAGVYRYWFEKTEISHDVVSLSYEKQKSGWLNQRYLPDLHVNGDIDEQVNLILGNHKQRASVCAKLNKIAQDHINFLKQLDDCLALADIEKFTDIAKQINAKVSKAIDCINELIESLHSDSLKYADEDNSVSIDDFDYLLKSLGENFEHTHPIHFSNLKKSIDKITESIAEENIFITVRQFKQDSLLILGEPGTGKSHGIANVVKEYNANKDHVAILVQAKSISINATWHDILTRVLGLSSTWNEGEIWQGLSALSCRNECRLTQENLNPIDDIYITPKVLICIDGIDELKPYDTWLDLIGETIAICKKYPRIKFCFSSRPHVFRAHSINSKIKFNVLKLASDGDVPVSKLFDDYISAYDIKLNGNEWIKWSIKTPLALKLFCELYEHKQLNELEQSSVTITNLLNRKIEKMDLEYSVSVDYGYDTNDNIVKKALLKLSNYFYGENQIEKSELINLLSDIDILKNASSQEVRYLTNFLEDYGMLRSYVISSDSILDSPKTYYEIGIQPIFDYLYAIIIVEKIRKNQLDNLPINLYGNNGTLQMTAIILLNDFDKLFIDYPIFKRNLANYDLFDLIFYAISNVAPSVSAKHVDFVKHLLTQGAYAVKEVINKVFLNVARIENHPLSPLILHQYLMGFDIVGQRDIVWSVPSIWGSSTAKWCNEVEVNLQDKNYKLTYEDKATGLPLIYAWSLTSVENLKRAYYRKELFNWGTLCPMEFVELFELTYQTNDPQMKEDLLSIAMGVVFTIPTDHIAIKAFGRWVLYEVFADGRIQNTHDAAIRYYSRAIAERAYSCGFITTEQLLLCRPPYKTSGEYITMNIDAMEGTVMSGYGPIDYDLSRYVLCDPIERQFFSMSFRYSRKNVQYQYYKKADEFLYEYAKQLKINGLKCHQFVLAACYAFLLEMGWNEQDFYGKPNGGKKGEVLGVDIAIIRQYSPATHGSKSSVMSFAEKYVWCAKNKILGYLADRLPFCDDDLQHMIEDYGVLEDFVIPAQEFDQSNLEEISNNREWYLPEMLSPTIECYKTSTEENIVEWINTSPIPNFILWINIDKNLFDTLLDCDNDFISLQSFNSQTEHSLGVETMMWISSGLITEMQFESFLNDIVKNENDITHEFMEPDRFTSSTESSCYLTPKEICWMTWKNDKYSKIEIYDLNNPDKLNYEITKMIENTVCNLDEHGEIYYKLPSKMARNMLGIIDGNGTQYYNREKKIVGINSQTGKKWGDYQQILCVDKNVLNREVRANNMQLFWIIRVLREPSVKSRERFPKLYYRRDRCWIVWFEDDKLKMQLFSDKTQ